MKTQHIEFGHKGKWILFDFTPTESDEWQSDGRYDYHYDEESNEVCVYEITEDGQTRTDESIHSQPINFGVSIELAKAVLRQAGYFVDNLWHVRDVASRYECEEDDAQEVLDGALTNEATMEQIWYAIDLYAQEYELKSIE